MSLRDNHKINSNATESHYGKSKLHITLKTAERIGADLVQTRDIRSENPKSFLR